MTFSERNKLAHIHYKSGEVDKAIELYELNIHLDDQTPATYNRLITIYRSRNDFDNQIRILRKLLVIHLAKLKMFEYAEKDQLTTFKIEKQKLVIDFIENSIKKIA